VYPGLTFAASQDAVWALEALPVSVSTTAVRLSLLFDSASTSMPDFEKILERYEHRMAVGMDEDIVVLEAQQLGLQSRLARAGRICPELEPSIHVFHRWYADQLIAAGIGTT
jgi:phenylpropionate dioxygenase-like ring-hydroxylating dioxygenase large terminal subunit